MTQKHLNMFVHCLKGSYISILSESCFPKLIVKFLEMGAETSVFFVPYLLLPVEFQEVISKFT